LDNNGKVVVTNSDGFKASKSKEPWVYKNNLYSLPNNIYKSVGRTWIHGANLALNKEYTVKYYIYWSV
jgi:hypothetical protein